MDLSGAPVIRQSGSSSAQPVQSAATVNPYAVERKLSNGTAVEVFLAKLRLFRVPELLAGSFVLALLAVATSFFLA